MNVDKNLFLYDLAFVSIMKNEGHYIKEWLDYHLLAGVNHFYIYDNDSTDNMKEILQPYIDAGIVTYIFYPGKAKQMEAYNDAVKKFRFYCRYMAFVDADEFFVPKSNRSLSEIADEILSGFKVSTAGFEAQWFMYGSNGEEKADYTRGVLERFTRRQKNMFDAAKSITNPRKINYIQTSHYPICFSNIYFINKYALEILFPDIGYKIADKIVMNHYHLKTKEEYLLRKSKGDVAFGKIQYQNLEEGFEKSDSVYNEVFDDSALKYRAARMGGGTGINTQPNYQKVLDTVIQTLIQARNSNTPPDFSVGKIETFLTCRSLANFFREKQMLDEKICDALENDSLVAIYKLFFSAISIPEFQLLMSELPKILTLKYPVVDAIISGCTKIISQVKDSIRLSCDNPDKLYMWKDFADWDYKLEMLKGFYAYRLKCHD